MNDAKVAIVTTLRNAASVIDSFIAYHLAIGFSRIFLFFDDPNDPDLARVSTLPSVTAIAHDEALRQAWKNMPQYAEQGPFTETEVMARQVLNVELAMGLAREAGLDWLLHIDADELFLFPRGDPTEHFTRLRREGIETANYVNYEAVSEKTDIGDFFREVDLFKVPPSLFDRPLTPEAVNLVRSVPQLQPQLFHFYGSGKSAVNLWAPKMRPKGVHFFERSDGACYGIESPEAIILHYPCCGFEHFWKKYVTLGRFSDHWWGKYDIGGLIGPFHLHARDIVARGDPALARAFYSQRAAIEDPRLVAALLHYGFLRRFPQPREILNRARG